MADKNETSKPAAPPEKPKMPENRLVHGENTFQKPFTARIPKK